MNKNFEIRVKPLAIKSMTSFRDLTKQIAYNKNANRIFIVSYLLSGKSINFCILENQNYKHLIISRLKIIN